MISTVDKSSSKLGFTAVKQLESPRSPFTAGFLPRASNPYSFPKVVTEDHISQLPFRTASIDGDELFAWLRDLLDVDDDITDLEAFVRDSQKLYELLRTVYPAFVQHHLLPGSRGSQSFTKPAFFDACLKLDLVTQDVLDRAQDSRMWQRIIIQIIHKMQQQWKVNKTQEVNHKHTDADSDSRIEPVRVERRLSKLSQSQVPWQRMPGPSFQAQLNDNQPNELNSAADGIRSQSDANPSRIMTRKSSKKTHARNVHDPVTVASHERQQSTSDELQSENFRETLVLDDRSFLLGNIIGRGQFGTVFRAIDASNGTTFAIKRIALEGQSIKEVDIMLHEVELLRQLSSPHIVRYEGFQRSDTHLSIITEYVENGSLLHSLKTFGHFSEKLTSAYTKELLAGLDYLHSKDVVHCDIKCANVLTTKSGTAKLSDFGVSLKLSGVTTLKTGVAAGTPYWIAPEVILLRGTSKASDIWALACTIVEMLTGKPPYSHLNTMAAMYSIVEDECPPIPTTESPQITAFLKACFRKEPRLRPSAADLRLHSWLMPEQTSGDPVAGPSQDMTTAVDKVLFSEHAAKAMLQSRRRSTIPSSDLPLEVLDEASVKTQLQYLSGVVLPRSEAPSPHPRFMRPSVHHLIKVGLKEVAICTICQRPVRKALYCNDCHSMVHPRCLVNNPVPCQFGNITSHSIVPFARLKTSQPILDPEIIRTLQFRQMVAKAKRGAKDFKTKLVSHMDHAHKPKRDSKSDHCTFM